MLNDDQYDAKHGITPSAKGVLLAETHVMESIKSLAYAITALTFASKQRIEAGSTKQTIIFEREKLAEYRDACYDLFFVHFHLIKHCNKKILKNVNDISSKLCNHATKNIHVTNL